MSKNERSLPDYKLIVNLKWWNMYIREKIVTALGVNVIMIVMIIIIIIIIIVIIVFLKTSCGFYS